MEKEGPALGVLPENASKENRNQIKGYATFGSFQWRLPDDELTCSSRLREVLEIGDNRTLTRWEHFVDCISPEDVKPFGTAIEKIIAGHNILDVDFKIIAPSGTKSLTLYGDVYRDHSGIPVILEGVIRVRSVSVATEQIQYVTNLLMDTVHTVNNKFTAILGSTAMVSSLVEEANEQPGLSPYIVEIEHEVFQAAELLRNLVQAAKRL